MEEIFDTLKFTKRALAVGFTAQQAEFHAEELAALLKETIVTQSILRKELMGLESRMQSFHYQIAGGVLAGMAALITIFEAVFHFTWGGK